MRSAVEELLEFGYREAQIDVGHGPVIGYVGRVILWVPQGDGTWFRYHREGDAWTPVPFKGEPDVIVTPAGQEVPYTRLDYHYPEAWLAAEYAGGNARRAGSEG